MKWIQIERAPDGFVITLPVEGMIVTPKYDPAIELYVTSGVRADFAEITFVGDQDFSLITKEPADSVVNRIDGLFKSKAISYFRK